MPVKELFCLLLGIGQRWVCWTLFALIGCRRTTLAKQKQHLRQSRISRLVSIHFSSILNYDGTCFQSSPPTPPLTPQHLQHVLISHLLMSCLPPDTVYNKSTAVATFVNLSSSISSEPSPLEYDPSTSVRNQEIYIHLCLNVFDFLYRGDCLWGLMFTTLVSECGKSGNNWIGLGITGWDMFGQAMVWKNGNSEW